MKKEIEIPEGYEARVEGNKVIIEQKESEDERIRKAILGLTYLEGIEPILTKCSVTKQNIRAWLEKQKEQKHSLNFDAISSWLRDHASRYVNSEYNEFHHCVEYDGTINIERLIADLKVAVDRGIFDVHEQKEQKPSTEETELNSIAFLEQMGYTCIPPKEQKPTDSEEKFESIDNAFRRGRETGFREGVESVKQSAEWGEEDECHLSAIILDLHALIDNSVNPPRFEKYIRGEQAWLRSLPKRFSLAHWKPSEEQMEALNEVISDERIEDTAACEKKAEILETLYNDLKKL